jgi:hypothetical protein
MFRSATNNGCTATLGYVTPQAMLEGQRAEIHTERESQTRSGSPTATAGRTG